MKKIAVLSIITLILLTGCVYADSWDDYADLDRAWDGQKSITNKEFEQAMDALQAKQKKKEARAKKRKARKISGGGTSLHTELNPDNKINEINIGGSKKDDGILINIPVPVRLEDCDLEEGFYKLIGEKDKSGKITLKFYQSQYLKGQIQAEETEEDFGEENVDFGRLLPYNDSFVKLIFGSIDFNAFCYIPCKK